MELLNFKEKNFTRESIKEFEMMSETPSHEMIEAIEKFVNWHKKDITSSQLRRIYSKIKSNKMTSESLPLVRIQLAYTMGRSEGKKRGMKLLLHHLDDMIANITPNSPDAKGKISSLQTFLEAVIAFHKYHQ